ncbi:InlB B-repeat-containing protein [Paenibacillus sp. FA6]|uniref:InlB B-repeat-containing protein n=1 Tax=Paenibacillus sp. FA6 TaxID=3413029 RepID=UPI003F656E9B
MFPLSQATASISLDIGTNRIDMEIGDDLDSYIWTPPVVVGNKLFIPWLDWSEDDNIATQYYSVIHSDGRVDTVLSIPVSPTTTGYPPDIYYKGLSNGNILIYWYSSYSSNGLTDTYFKIIDPAGTQVVAPTKINSSPGSLNRFTEVTELSNGNLAFVWDTNEGSYALRRFTTTGVAVDANQISITGLAGISGSQYNHRIAANNSGQFMISISYYNTNYLGMIFNDTGTTPIRVGGQNSFVYGANTETPNGNQYVKALSNNKFLFVYHKKVGLDVDTRSIYYRIYNADGTLYTNEMLVDTLNTWGAVNEPIITDDGFIISYSFNDNIVNNQFLRQYNNAGILQNQSSPNYPELEGGSAIGFLFQDIDGNLSYIANKKTSGAASYDTWLLRHLTSGPSSYNVTFEDWDGTELKTETVNHGSGATAPTNPSRTGYTFTGWDNAFGNITSALTVKAQYSVNSSYAVSFDSQSGSAVDDINTTYGSKITAPTPPTRANYIFDGWYKEAGTVNQWNFATETILANHVTLYAGWILNSYAVTFEDWDGTELKTETVNHGSGATTPTNPSRVGYTFTGWDVAFGNITGGLTVKAQYSVNSSYTVSFDSQGGSGVGNINATYGSKITAPTPPTRANYTFGGWYKESGTENQWNFATETIPANHVTLYANWILSSYTVTFEDWDETELKTEMVNHGSGATAPTNPSRVGYTFTGWDVAFGNITGALTVKAQYSVNSGYTVIFDSQSGSAVNVITATYGSKITAPTDPTRVGYTFEGWFKETGAENQWVFATETIQANHVTLYAGWILNSYAVTFEDWDETELKTETVNHGSGATAPTNPSRVGYAFTGWDVTFGNITSALTVKAQYSVNGSYTVSFDSQGGSEVDDIDTTYDSRIIAPTPPTRANYSFGGWYKEAGTVNKWDFLTESMPANDVTLYAKWIYRAPSGNGTESDGKVQYIMESNGTVQYNNNIKVNDRQEKIGILKITKQNGQDIATVTIDTQLLLQMLGNEPNAQITVPIDLDLDKVTLILNGQLVKDLARKNIIIVLSTRDGQYKLPTSEIDMDIIAKQLGVESLETLALSIEISKLTAEEEMLVANSLKTGGYTPVAPPVHFSVYVAYGNRKIELSKFQVYIERFISLPDGTDISKISTAVVIEKDGNLRHIPTKIEHMNGKNFAVIHSLSNSIYALIWNPVTFVDVENHWSKDAVNNVASRMIISGTGNGLFQPDKFISRAEFAAIIVRTLGIELEPGTAPFSDINQTDWHFDNVKAAYEYGIINGYSDGSFKPTDTMTREQAMSMLARAMKITGLTVQADIHALEKFTDSGQIAAWAKDDVAATLHAGIVNGGDASALKPKSLITRAEVATMVERLLKKSGMI